MERLTYFDYLANCYKMKPDAPQRLIIQRLGKYEDARAAVNAAELQKILENLKDETLEVPTIKGDAWTAGFNEGIRVAEEIIRGAIHD
jgi:hypothetical protein